MMYLPRLTPREPTRKRSQIAPRGPSNREGRARMRRCQNHTAHVTSVRDITALPDDCNQATTVIA